VFIKKETSLTDNYLYKTEASSIDSSIIV